MARSRPISENSLEIRARIARSRPFSEKSLKIRAHNALSHHWTAASIVVGYLELLAGIRDEILENEDNGPPNAWKEYVKDSREARWPRSTDPLENFRSFLGRVVKHVSVGLGASEFTTGKLAEVGEEIEACGVWGITAHEAAIMLGGEVRNAVNTAVGYMPLGAQRHDPNEDSADKQLKDEEFTLISHEDSQGRLVEIGKSHGFDPDCITEKTLESACKAIDFLGHAELQNLERKIRREYAIARERDKKRRGEDDAELPRLDAAIRQPADNPQEKITREEGDSVARKLDRRNKTFRGGTAEQWAKAIQRHTSKSCSATTVKKTDFWKEVMAATGRGKSKGKAPGPRAVPLTPEVLASKGDDGAADPLRELIACEEEDAIQTVMNSKLRDREKAAIVKQVKDGELTPAQAKEMVSVTTTGREYERSPLEDGPGKVRHHKQM